MCFVRLTLRDAPLASPGSAFGLTLGVRRPQGPLAVKKQFGREKEFTSKWS